MSPKRVTLVAAFACLLVLLMTIGGCSEEKGEKPKTDTDPPELVSATAVDVIHVNVTFNEKLDETTAEDPANYTITPEMVTSSVTLPAVVGAVLLEDEKNVLLETGAQIDHGYVLEVSGVEDLAGNAMEAQTTSFTGTTQGDTTAPVLVRTIPAQSASGVDTLATVTMEFSERMNTASVESNFGLESANDPGHDVVGSFSWEDNDTRGIFTPASPLDYLTIYYAYIGSGAMDAAGNGLEWDHYWQFMTGAGGVVTGTISYSPLTPQDVSQVYGGVFVGLFDEPCFDEPVIETWVESLGSYTVGPAPPGTYYVAAALDENEISVGEPVGMYDPDKDEAPNPVVVEAGQTTGGINLSLDYEFKLCTVSGTITKSPDVTESDTTYVLFFPEDPTRGESVDPLGMAVLPDGTGPYTSSPLFFGCYYVICFMDINGNGELDFVGDMPAEPIGLYGEWTSGHEPALERVFVIDDVTDIDMMLEDVTGYAVPPILVSRVRDMVRSGSASVSFLRRD
jgi:hypothetical protein